MYATKLEEASVAFITAEVGRVGIVENRMCLERLVRKNIPGAFTYYFDCDVRRLHLGLARNSDKLLQNGSIDSDASPAIFVLLLHKMAQACDFVGGSPHHNLFFFECIGV